MQSEKVRDHMSAIYIYISAANGILPSWASDNINHIKGDQQEISTRREPAVPILKNRKKSLFIHLFNGKKYLYYIY